MRKSKILKLNNQLFEDNQKYKLRCEDLEQENKTLLEEIEELKKDIAELTNMQIPSAPLKELTNKITEQAMLSKPEKYAASAIGKIVVKATICCNTLTSAQDGYDPKELINLILGRTEIAKSDILAAIESQMTDENKLLLIDNCVSEAEEYFNSIMAQKE